MLEPVLSIQASPYDKDIAFRFKSYQKLFFFPFLIHVGLYKGPVMKDQFFKIYEEKGIVSNSLLFIYLKNVIY